MRTKRLEKLWQHMTALYGCRWSVEYGFATSASGELEPLAAVWANALDDLPNDALARGLRKLLARDSPHPPSLPEFLRLCGARFNAPPSPPSNLPALPAAAYADSPSQRCQRLAEMLAQQARRDLTPRVEQMLPHDRPKATLAYWQSLTAAALQAGKADEVFPPGWRDASGMPKPEPRPKNRNDLAPIGERLQGAVPMAAAA